MKLFSTIEDFVTAIKKCIQEEEKGCILYGAGQAGKTIYSFLKAKHIAVSAFAVTNPGIHGEIDGVPVLGIDDILERHLSSKSNIVIAVTRMNQPEIEKELEKRNILFYIELSDLLLYKLAKENQKTAAEAAGQSMVKGQTGRTVGYLSPGYLNSDYAEKRLIIDKIEGVSYVAIPKETADIAWIDGTYEKQPETYRQLTEACYCPNSYKPAVTLIHSFNTVCRTDEPWCASFETAMPRMWPETAEEREYYLRLVEHIKKPNCKALYALCKNAYDLQKTSLLQHISLQDTELIMNKTKVLHPPQNILVTEEEFRKKHDVPKIRFLFIGRAFFIKGGKEMLDVLSEFEEKYCFDLTLISSLQYGDYYTQTSYEEMCRCKSIIQKKPWIHYYESLPNEEVLAKCKEATVGLLPSFADTYGYVVLEMQASGCPVVTTNVRAFPETNNEECGWVCRLPVDELGFCAEQDAAVRSELLKKELRRQFQEIFDAPEKIRGKGLKTLERIRRMHDPYEYQKELRKNLGLDTKT